MLDYTKKNINIITLCITIVVCVILFIMLDFCFLKKTQISRFERDSYQSYSIGSVEKEKNRKVNAIELGDTFLETMQIADIYDENTRVDELENLSEVEEDNELEESEKQNININTNAKWRIEIPKINLKAPIKSGTSQSVLATAVGHFPNTNKWNGNVALAGHNRGYNCNFFQHIKELEIGDKIIYYTEQGKKKYKVVLNKIIKQTDWSYVQDTEDNRITLITCVENMYEYRRCIQAVEII